MTPDPAVSGCRRDQQERVEALIDEAERDLRAAEPLLIRGARMVRQGWVQNLLIDLRAALAGEVNPE